MDWHHTRVHVSCTEKIVYFLAHAHFVLNIDYADLGVCTYNPALLHGYKFVIGMSL